MFPSVRFMDSEGLHQSHFLYGNLDGPGTYV